MTPTLRSERLLLSPYTPDDEDDFVALLRDEEVCKWMGQERQPEETIRQLFALLFSEVYPNAMFDVWAVRLDGRYIGHAELKKTGNVDGHELICALVRDVWRMGLGTELSYRVIDYGFDELGLAEIHGCVDANNTRSLAMARKAGFEIVRDVTGSDGTVTRVVTLRAAARHLLRK
ncbi:GNAT family N-acetyltransferase [Kutzneria sp. NPDC052558]|uniref:GNAT family N-acetyltransferase n=1 Tax=Kutzneria sp. NPDC052558 TaxID=3364121 RepID=UPI0037C9A850